MNDISLNVERMNEYLFLNPDGTPSAHKQAPDLGNGVLNQMMTYIVRISNSLEEFKDDMGEFRIETNRRLANLKCRTEI